MYDEVIAARCIVVYADVAIKAAEAKDWKAYHEALLDALQSTHSALHYHFTNPKEQQHE